MKRAISPSEEEKVREYYNRTADQLGISRPLNSESWFEIKDHLKEKYTAGFPAEWSQEEACLHSMSCADLAIDPGPTRHSVISFLLCWIGSPSDQHGVISEVLRMIFLISISLLSSYAVLQIANVLGFYEPHAPSVFALAFFILFMMGLVISGDTHVGAVGLFFLMAGCIGFATVHLATGLMWWLRVICSAGGLLLGATFFFASILN